MSSSCPTRRRAGRVRRHFSRFRDQTLSDKRSLPLFAAVLTLLAALAVPGRGASAAPITSTLTASIAPTGLVPGQAGFGFVSGGYPLDVSVTLDDAPLGVYWTGKGYIALYSFGFDEPPGLHTLSVSAYNPLTGESLTRQETITVSAYYYPDQYVALPFALLPLLDPALNEAEEARLGAIYTGRSRLAGWDWPFEVPAPEAIVTSRFGGQRSYNSGMWRSRHTGTDFRLGVGDPVRATARGRVAAAEFMDVRGNVVVLDHGYGIFSQYAHLSDMVVQPGQLVEQGQVIGSAGATGRTNGPHLHFEIIVNGQPVDPIRWMSIDPDFIPPREVLPDEEDAEN